MAYSFKQIEAHDPSNPGLVAPNASVTIFEPGDPAKTPLTLTRITGEPLPNPVTVNGLGYGPAFMHATLPQVAWSGGGLTGTFESYEGLRDEAIAARDAANTAAADAAAEAQAAIGDATVAAEAAAEAAEAAAALVGAPADTAIATAINSDGSETKAALSATIATATVDKAPLVSTRFRRTKTRNTGVLRPQIRDISKRVARVKPKITMTNITTSIPNPVTTTITAASPEINYWGSIAWQVGTAGFGPLDPHSTTYVPPWSWETVTDSPLFAPEITGGGQLVEVLCNDEVIFEASLLSGGASMLINWNGVRKMRRYTFRGQGGMAVKTIRRNAQDSLFAPKRDSDIKAAWMSDSYGQTMSSDGIATLPMLTCDMLGWKVAASVEGGSGYDQPNPATTIANFKERVPDIIAANPDVVILAGGHNIRDVNTEEQAIRDTINGIKAGLPGVPIFAFGAFYGSAPGESGYTAENAKIEAVCAETGATYLSTSGWVNGTGKDGSPANNGNADILIKSDGIHPMAGIGGDFFAARCADAITGSAAI